MSTNFAVIETLGRQYKVAVGDRIKVDLITTGKEDPTGTKVTFDQVLLVGSSGESAAVKVGTPVVAGATVVGTIVEEGKDKKGVAFKKKRRQGYTRKVGFRRQFTVVQIDAILAA